MNHSPPQLGAKSRSRALREWLDTLARQAGAGAKLPKVADLCRELGVSPTTLNGVFGEMEQEGILLRRHAVGIFVADNAPVAPHFGVICHPRFFQNDGNSPLWQYLINSIHAHTENLADTFDCYFSRSGDTEEALPPALAEEIRQGAFSGLLGIAIPGDTAWWIMKQGVPMVSLFSKGHVIINTNGAREVLLAVEQLKIRGCQSVGAWGRVWPYHDVATEKREAMKRSDLFRQAMQHWQMPLHQKWIETNLQYLGTSQVPSLPEQGYEMAMRVFGKRGSKPDGLWIWDENVTRGALVALQKLGVRVGEDVQIASHVNRGLQVLWGHEDKLILVEYDPAQYVETMFEKLRDLISGRLPMREDQLATIEPQVRV